MQVKACIALSASGCPYGWGSRLVMCNVHRTQVTCGVALEALDPVLGKIRRALKHGGVRAKLITSGSGNWRFLDIVSANAVRQLQRIGM